MNLDEIKKNSNKLEENFETSEKIRKYKKVVRRIKKLKMLSIEIEREYSKSYKHKCCWGTSILFMAFFYTIVIDFILPLALNYRNDKYYNDDNKNKGYSLGINGRPSFIYIIFGVLTMFLASIITSPYTIITIYTTIRKRYISGDYLYDKKINDEISLMKSVQLIYGYSFTLIYCNLFLWKAANYKGNFGKPYLYDKIIIPDYVIYQGLSILMIIKIILSV